MSDGMNGIIDLFSSILAAAYAYWHWSLVWSVVSDFILLYHSVGHHRSPTFFTSSMTNKCHPFHCSIPTIHDHETTKRDGMTLDIISNCFVLRSCERMSNSTAYTIVPANSILTPQDRHMTISRTTPMISSYWSILPPTNNDGTHIGGDWWGRVAVGQRLVRL